MNTNKKRRCARRLSHDKVFTPKNFSEGEIYILLDEFEAMRLVDYENYSQIEASEQMNVSRATIQRLLNSARSKFVEASLTDKTLIINNNTKDISLKGEHGMNKHSKQEFLIAIPTVDKKVVSDNFGGAGFFAVYKVKNEQVNFVEFLNLSEHIKGVYPKILQENNIDVVLTKRIGVKALQLFKELEIDVVLGAIGEFEFVIDEYLKGTMNLEKPTRQYVRNANCNKARGKGLKRGSGFGRQQGFGLGRGRVD